MILFKRLNFGRAKVATSLIALIVSGIIVYLVLSKFDLRPILQISYGTLFVILLFSILSKVIYVLPNAQLLQDMGYTINRWPLFLILEASYSGNYLAPAKLGIPLRIALYRQVLKVDTSSGLACTALSNFFWLALILSIAFVGLLLRSTNLSIEPVTIGILGLIVGMGLFLIIPYDIISSLVQNLPARKVWLRFIHFLSAAQSSLKRVKWTTSLFYFCVVALKLWIQAFTAYLILKDLGWEGSSWSILWVLCISLAVGVITLLPMGIGTQDASFIFLLTSVGVTQDLAVLVTLVDRIVFTAIPFLTGIISANILGIDILNRIKTLD